MRAHERADLSTLLYELIRALTLKATWSPVSVPRGRKCCNEDNLWTSLSGSTSPEHVICPSPKARLTSAWFSHKHLKPKRCKLSFPGNSSSSSICTSGWHRGQPRVLSSSLPSRPGQSPAKAHSEARSASILFSPCLLWPLWPSCPPPSPAQLQQTSLGPRLCVPSACHWSFLKSVILSLSVLY